MSLLELGAVVIVPLVKVTDVMSVFVPLCAALKFVRAVVAVVAPVPPLAIATTPLTLAAEPVTLIPQVPDAPVPVRLGTLKLVRAFAAVVAPVPPLATFTVPLRVMVPFVVIGPPEVVKPVEPPDTATEVTVPVPLPPPPPSFTLVNKLKKKRYQSLDTTPFVEMADWFLGSWGRLSGLGICAGQN